VLVGPTRQGANHELYGTRVDDLLLAPKAFRGFS
jgi:hypothetical protein